MRDNMGSVSKYFFNLAAKTLNLSHAYEAKLQLYVNNCSVNEYGQCYWYNTYTQEIQACGDIGKLTKAFIIGVSLEYISCVYWLKASCTNECQKRLICIPFEWTRCGTQWCFAKQVMHDSFCKELRAQLEHAFSYMLDLSDKGINIFINNVLAMKKHTAFQHRMEIDLMNDPE